MSHTPIVLGPRSYSVPATVEGVMQAFDEIQREHERVFETNLLLAVAAGDLDEVDSVDQALHVARRLTASSRAEVLRRVEQVLATVHAWVPERPK